jgi:murein L,D-transpeptidase YcbB/YkuD
MGTPLVRALGLAVVVIATACDRGPQVDNLQHASAIQRIVSSTPAWVGRDPLAATLWKAERQFYQSRNNLPAWVDGDNASARLDALVDALAHSEDHGLDPARYGADRFQQIVAQAKQNENRYASGRVPEIDARLTYAYLQYAADLLGWSGNPKAISTNWIRADNKADLAGQLAKAVSSNQVRETLEELAPTHPQYKGLQTALAGERQNPTGHLDRIRMNLVRWRWMPRELGDRYVFVNVPAYQMQVMEGGKPVLAMRVIVGDPEHQTPLFSDEMTTIVFSPNWNVPESIIRKEMLPKLVDDPGFLQRQNIQVVGTSGQVIDQNAVDWYDESAVARLRFRQEPGPKNALGLVKFQFPNPFDVYMHDTPQDALFNKEHRALSHGCIRLENPMALAQYVLRDKPDWTTEKITAAMNAGKEQAFPLKEHLPVHIGYFTAWVNPDGSATYTDDPYGLDEQQTRIVAPSRLAGGGHVGRSASNSARRESALASVPSYLHPR